MEREFLKKQRRGLPGKPVKFAFIADMAEENERIPHAGRFPVDFMCEMLGVTRGQCHLDKQRSDSSPYIHSATRPRL
jgi:hypothetical protein